MRVPLALPGERSSSRGGPRLPRVSPAPLGRKPVGETVRESSRASPGKPGRRMPSRPALHSRFCLERLASLDGPGTQECARTSQRQVSRGPVTQRGVAQVKRDGRRGQAPLWLDLSQIAPRGKPAPGRRRGCSEHRDGRRARCRVSFPSSCQFYLSL